MMEWNCYDIIPLLTSFIIYYCKKSIEFRFNKFDIKPEINNFNKYYSLIILYTFTNDPTDQQ